MRTEFGIIETLIEERDQARALVESYDRLAHHLLIMHRRENRRMEGGEEEIERLRALWREWTERRIAAGEFSA